VREHHVSSDRHTRKRSSGSSWRAYRRRARSRRRRDGTAFRAHCCSDGDGRFARSDKLTLPYQPFIGTIGTSPEIEAITSLQPDYYGGNMDLPDVGVDAVIYLPVNPQLNSRESGSHPWTTCLRY
jgi:hypothetical protein